MTKKNLENLKDPNYLPTLNELKAAFPTKDNLKLQNKNTPYLNPDFTRFLDKYNRYQVYTQEFITSLAKYISNRVKILGGDVTIIELGAGDGRLSKFLTESPFFPTNTKIIASDSKDWEQKGDTNKSINVLKMDYQLTLKKFAKKPTIVISSWMNIDVNWTPTFRSNKAIVEYILIGDLFRTADYGAGWILPAKSNFTCVKLASTKKDDLVKGSIGRFAGSPHNPDTRAHVYSFRRIKK